MRKQMTLPPDREIAALVPVYTGKGDYTRLIMINGDEQLIPCTLRSVMKSIARRSCKDLALMRDWSAKITCRSLNNPVPIDALLVLTPYKARLPRIEGDEVMGCVNPLAVERIVSNKIKPLPAKFAGQKRPKELKTKIIMKNGQSLDSYWNEKTLTNHLKDGRSVQNLLVREMDENIMYLFRNHPKVLN